MNLAPSMIGGVAGATALTVAHEVLRRSVPNAPRMDVIGERGLRKVFQFAGLKAPQGKDLFEAALVGDLLSNAATYSLVGSGRNAEVKGALLGATLGIGAVLLPGPLGLGRVPARKPGPTDLMTIGLYTLGGFVAGLVARRFARA